MATLGFCACSCADIIAMRVVSLKQTMLLSPESGPAYACVKRSGYPEKLCLCHFIVSVIFDSTHSRRTMHAHPLSTQGTLCAGFQPPREAPRHPPRIIIFPKPGEPLQSVPAILHENMTVHNHPRSHQAPSALSSSPTPRGRNLFLRDAKPPSSNYAALT